MLNVMDGVKIPSIPEMVAQIEAKKEADRKYGEIRHVDYLDTIRRSLEPQPHWLHSNC